MDRIRILGLLLLTAGLCLVGCGPSRGASLSPDGRFVAYNDKDSVVIHSFVDRRADRRVSITEPGPPSYSPDGKWLVVPTTMETILLNGEGEEVGILPNIDLPIAWNPDSSEFVGCLGKSAVVVHVASRSIVRKYNLPIKPLQAVWMGPGRNLAFCSSDTVVTVVGGRVYRKDLADSWLSVGYDTNKGTLTVVADRWIQNRVKMSKTKLPVEEPFSIYSADPELKDVHLTDKKIGADPHLLSKPGVVQVFLDSVSPDGHHVALISVVDHSPPGLLHKFEVMDDAIGHMSPSDPQTKKLKREISALARRLRIRFDFDVEGIAMNSHGVKSVFVSKAGPIDTFTNSQPVLAWSPDSSSVAVVSYFGVTREKVDL